MIEISPIETDDFERLFRIEQAAHSVPWSMGTLLNNQGDNYGMERCGHYTAL